MPEEETERKKPSLRTHLGSRDRRGIIDKDSC
jgi:hypothetical protein